MNRRSGSKKTLRRLAQALTATAVATGPLALAAEQPAASWLDNAVSPGVNPIFFEDPRITSEVRPVFMEHYLPANFQFKGGTAPLGGDLQVYALQLRYAVSDRLGIIATKDGYIDMNPKHTLPHARGWGDLAAGLKYALIDDRANSFILTPGFTFTAPTGSQQVGQRRGTGEWNAFVSAAKGFGDMHVTANGGFRLPHEWDQQTAQAHYSLQLDYQIDPKLVPFVAVNGYTVLSDGNRKLLGEVPLNTEMYDLINFGSTEARGTTQLTFGGGVRSKLTSSVEVGAAYEMGILSPKGIFDGRITADLIWRF